MNDVTAPEKPSTGTFTELNVRQEKGKPHFIRLHDSVVKKLERQLAANPGSAGLLLGSIEVNENCTIAVEQFEATTRLEELIRARKSGSTHRVVGYYRSYSQDSFALDPADRALFQRCFPKESRLLLLVKPPKAAVGTAMFFLGENGQLAAERSTVEFPFNLRELGAEEAPAATSAVELLPAPRSRGGLLWKLAMAGVVVIASVFGLSELRIFDRTGEPPQPKNLAVEKAAPVEQTPVAQAPSTPPEVKPVIAATSAKPAPPPKTKPVAAAGPIAQQTTTTIAKTPAPITPAATEPRPVQTVLPPPVPDAQPPVNSERDSSPPVVAPPVPVSPKPAVPSVIYTPPNAIRQIAPLVPESVRRSIKEDVVVRVRVNVDATGKVTGATPVETGNPVAEALAQAAVSSIKRWQFEPAHRGSDKVPGDVVLSFTFRK
jgi:TonB family C-terminal domain